MIFHDPDATRDYWVVFSLGGDVVSSITGVVVDGCSVSVESSAVNADTLTDRDGVAYDPGTVVVLWLSGGVLGERGLMTISYETDGGRVDDCEIVIECAND